MKSKLMKTLLLALAIMALCSISALADTIGGGTVTADALHLRTEATQSAASQKLIPQNSFLLVEEKLDGWYKVLYNGEEGYVSADYVNFAQELDGEYSCKGVVKGDYVRLRAAASTESTVIGVYNSGIGFDVLGVSGEWIKVLSDSGNVGYIRSDLIDCGLGGTTAAAASVSSTDLGSQIVATAKEYLGYRYVWGGMSTSGFDCSGFVNYIYKLYGYSMNRVAQNIYSNDGTSVAKSELQPGDLVFFGYSAYSVTHVGMYIGDGQFIHASSSAGQVVITSLSENYYTRMYVGAKRIL